MLKEVHLPSGLAARPSLPRVKFGAILSATAPVLLAVALFGLQGYWSARHESQTWDEAYAVAAGYLQVSRNDFSLLPENPPLLGILVSGPLVLAGAKLPAVSPAGSGRRNPVKFGKDFFYSSGNAHLGLLMSSRLPVLLLNLLAVGAVVVWARRLHGPGASWIAAGLCAFEPNWLAHGHLAAWDGICTATIILAAFSLAMFLDLPSVPKALTAGFCTGLALVAKYTSLLLLPCIVLLALLSALRPGRLLVEHRVTAPVSGGRQFLLWGVLAATALFVVGASYNLAFRYDLYLEGLSQVYRLGRDNYMNFFFGTYRLENFPLYYLGAVLLKTPVGFLLLYVMGLATLPFTLRKAHAAPAILLCFGIFFVTAFNRHNIGIRHALPAIPLLILIAAGVWRSSPFGQVFSAAAWKSLVVILLFMGAVESFAQAPHYLSFFNLGAGGPRGGIRFLDDSNIDWGQDLIALEKVQRDEAVPVIALEYFGSAVPKAYGVHSRAVLDAEFLSPRPGTVYAVSLHLLSRLALIHGPDADWLKKYTPWRIAGNSIYLYKF